MVAQGISPADQVHKSLAAFHLVDKLFYRNDREPSGAVEYADAAENAGDAWLVPDAGTSAVERDFVFNYFASLALLAPEDGDNTYKQRVEGTWSTKQMELVEKVGGESAKAQIAEWNVFTGALQKLLDAKFSGNAPTLVLIAVAKDPVVAPDPTPALPTELTDEENAVLGDFENELERLITDLGTMYVIYEDLVHVGVANSVLASIDSEMDRISEVDFPDDRVRTLGEQSKILEDLLGKVGEALETISTEYSTTPGVVDLIEKAQEVF